MTKVIFYAYFLKCIPLNISIKYSTVKAVKYLALALKIKSFGLSIEDQVLGLGLGFEGQVFVNITAVGWSYQMISVEPKKISSNLNSTIVAMIYENLTILAG